SYAVARVALSAKTPVGSKCSALAWYNLASSKTEAMTLPNLVASLSAWALIVSHYRSTASTTSATSSQTTPDSSNASKTTKCRGDPCGRPVPDTCGILRSLIYVGY